MTLKYKKRRYFVIERDGCLQGVLAPLAEFETGIGILLEKPDVREIDFDEFMPIWWSYSDYTSEPPYHLTEEQFWLAEY